MPKAMCLPSVLSLVLSAVLVKLVKLISHVSVWLFFQQLPLGYNFYTVHLQYNILYFHYILSNVHTFRHNDYKIITQLHSSRQLRKYLISHFCWGKNTSMKNTAFQFAKHCR